MMVMSLARGEAKFRRRAPPANGAQAMLLKLIISRKFVVVVVSAPLSLGWLADRPAGRSLSLETALRAAAAL
jgi:uncharacterized membrane protein YraQ (UPF0718 family)